MAVYQSLSVTEVAGSQSVANNTSQINIKWTSQQTGDSWNGYTRTAYYYVSENGGAEKEYSITYTLPQNGTAVLLDTTITVSHMADGTGSISVRTWMDTGISAGIVEKSRIITLETIPRISAPTLSAGSVYVGNGITVYTNRQSKSFTHHLYYSVNNGAEVGITAGIEDSITWVVPYELMSNIPNDSKMTITFRLYTFSGDTNLGSKQISFTAYVPANSYAAPGITIKEIKPISNLSPPFDTLFIQGRSRVKADFTAEGKYGSSITSCSIIVEGERYDSTDEYTSEYLKEYGSVAVTITATDTRGVTCSVTENVDVMAYGKPKILEADGEADIICARCDADGNISDSGTYLKVKARRSYSKVVSEEQKNFCAITVRHRPSDGEFSEWTTILDKEDLTTNTIDSAPLLDGALSVDTSYDVQVGVKDDISDVVYTTFHIPTDKIQSHEGNGFLALGKYSEKAGFECAWPAEFYDAVTIRGGAITDFPVEEGVDDIWSYRKWHSGIAECWGLYAITGAEIATAWGSVYETAVNYQKAFPVGLFIDAPVTHYTAQTSNGGGCLAVEAVGETTKDQTCSLFPIRATPQTVDLVIAIRATGKWK
jgi:hypothetical protein